MNPTASYFDALVAGDVERIQELLTTIIVGRTEMSGSFDGAKFAAASRYTRVLLCERDGRWRLASAQATRIVAP